MGITVESNRSNIAVTVIVPVHNSEKYLRSCLTSALQQTLKNIEILCIDTGSTDSSSQIISELQAMDNRLVYIKDPNSSYGHKINKGIELARGDYIAILESDDEMGRDMLEKLYTKAAAYGADVVDGGYFRVFSYRDKKLYAPCGCTNLAEYDQLVTKKGDNASGFIMTNEIWSALYQKKFLVEQSIRLNESPGASYQDASFVFLVRVLARSGYRLSVPLYEYRVDNAGSSINDDKKIFEVVGEYQFLKSELEKRRIENQNVWKFYYTAKYGGFLWNYCRLSPKSRELFLERYLEELQADIAHGAVSRENCDENLYNRTFLLFDDLDKFKAEADSHQPIEAIGKTLDRIGTQAVVIFGAGTLGIRVLSVLQQNGNRILGICDNAERLHGTVVNGIEVCPVAETVKRFPDACYLIVNYRHSGEMKAQLRSGGVPEGNIEVFS